VKVRIIRGPCGSLAFCPEGYGDFENIDGIPLMLELFDGVLSVIVWGDINDEEYTAKISLEGAREELRKPADDQSGV